MRRYLRIGLCSLLVLLMLPITLLLIGFLTPSQYGNTFLGELEVKYNRLYEIDEPKIVLIGGSSVAFGYDTALMEEHLGMPVVNFGLYASLGTKVMLDLSEDAIGEGDIIVLAPETDPQTFSLYFSGESFWQAADSDFSMLSGVASENVQSLVGAYWGYLEQKLYFLKNGAPNPEGVYNKASFDERGDLVYERPHNVMLLGYDTGLTVNLDASIVDDAFIDYVNAYIERVREKGATVYFSFPPINKSSLAPGTDEDTIFAFYDYLSRALDCEIITNPNDCILEKGYFYDSNFHLNDSGVVVRTATMIKDILRATGVSKTVSIELPEAPEIPPINFGDPDDPTLSVDADCFTYTEIDGALIVSGLSDEGKTRESLMVPAYANGMPVVALGEYAVKDAENLTQLIVNGNIREIHNKAFAGCDTLTSVHLTMTADKVLVSTEGLFDETNADLRICVSTEIFGSYRSDYFWANYGDRIVAQ